jgi:hypothetical protein
MTGTMGGWRTREIGKGGPLKLAAFAAALAVLSVALRVLAPMLLGIAEMVLGIGQACVTWLRSGGF